jgi:hypothetical protein
MSITIVPLPEFDNAYVSCVICKQGTTNRWVSLFSGSLCGYCKAEFIQDFDSPVGRGYRTRAREERIILTAFSRNRDKVYMFGEEF